MEQVNVLVSTYNGEQYIKEQLESIFAQTYKNIKVYVRDDGSTDHTCQILEQYERRQQIILIKGKNVGYGQSFMYLLDVASDGDFWAFSDQDDKWEPEKLEKAVNYLKEKKQDCPLLYCHAYYITDKDLNITGTENSTQDKYSFQKAITECVHMGFASVINSSLRECMLRGKGYDLISHDWWAEMIAMEFGHVYSDSYIGAKHRRLENSVSGNNLVNRFRWLRRSLHGETEIHNLTRNFYDIFGNQMNEADKRVLSWFVYDKYDFSKAVKKVFYYKRWRSSIASECVVRTLMLLGKI